MPRKLKGIRRRHHAWEVNVRVHGHLYTATFPLTTPVQELRDWREEQVEKFGGTPDAAGGLAETVRAYLLRKAAMPTIDQVTAHLALWVHALGGDRPPLSVTTADIDIVIQGWLEEGLAPGTVRKRRSALRSFYSKQYPKKVSPVKGSENPKEPEAEARDMGYAALERALAMMPDGRDTKKGLPRRVSLSKIRARVIAYVGIPQGMLKQVHSHDLVLTGAGSVRVTARRKGGGVEARTVPLTADGLAAFQAFHAANAYGSFATESLNRSFKRGCKRAGVDPKRVHMYDARHTFLSQVYRVTRDLATVGRLGLHKKGSVVTPRYAKGANQDVDAAAVAAFSTALAEQRQLALKKAAADGQLDGQLSDAPVAIRGTHRHRTRPALTRRSRRVLRAIAK